MGDAFQFDEEFYPVPPAAVDADPIEEMRQLCYRTSSLEQGLEDQCQQDQADLAQVLLEVIGIRDALTKMVEDFGVQTRAREAAMVRNLVTFGQQLDKVLGRFGVGAIDTIGRIYDPRTSDVVLRTSSDEVPPGTVLREIEAGYSWPHGLLKRAQVVVAVQPEVDADDEDDAGDRGEE